MAHCPGCHGTYYASVAKSIHGKETLVPVKTQCPGCGHEAQIKKHEATIKAIVEWLEANQPDVFRRGLWDAIRVAKGE